MKTDVFISYSKADTDCAKRLAEELQGRGIRVWFDEWEIHPGANVVRNIQDGLSKSILLLVLLSRSSLQSNWVEEEWTKKFNEEVSKGEITVVPILLEHIEENRIPLLLGGKKYIKLYESGMQKVLKDLAKLIEKRRQTEFLRPYHENKEFQSRLADAFMRRMEKGPERIFSRIAQSILEKVENAASFTTRERIELVLREVEFQIHLVSEEYNELKIKQQKDPSEFLVIELGVKADLTRLLDNLKKKILFLKSRGIPINDILKDVILELTSVSRGKDDD